jgi:hypothetical protein
MAQAKYFQLRRDGMKERHVHGHRVGVVEQPRIGAHLRHVLGNPGENREGPQSAEDASDPDGVSDGLIQPVARRDVEITLGRLEHPDLDGVDDVVGTVERPAPIRGGVDLGCGTGRPCRCTRDHLRCRQPIDIDVVQDDSGCGQLGKREDVAKQLAGELDAACADDHDGGLVRCSPV